MPTIHCKKCTPEKPCGDYHLYVIEFHSNVEETYRNKSEKGYLYVGSTSKAVEKRFEDNFIKIEGEWKYNSPNSKELESILNNLDLIYFIKVLTPCPNLKKVIKI